MDQLDSLQLSSPNGEFYWAPDSPRALIRFQGAWMSLKREQMLEIGCTLGHILTCPFSRHYLEAGMVLSCSLGEYRMPLCEETASELLGLLNDALLLMEAVQIAA